MVPLLRYTSLRMTGIDPIPIVILSEAKNPTISIVIARKYDVAIYFIIYNVLCHWNKVPKS